MKKISAALSALVLASCTTHIPIRTEITINAAREIVFAKLVDFASYSQWNPYHIRVNGKPQVGEKLDIRVRRPDGKVINVPAVHLLRRTDNHELTWGGGIPGLFYGEHVFLLENAENGGTKLIHTEDFTGLFIGFADLPPEVLDAGYRQMNQSLKLIIENNSVKAAEN